MTLRTSNFDAIAAASPLDRQASTVRDGSGDLWDHEVTAQAHWKAPPPPLESLKAGMPDLAGASFGRLTVVRYHGRSGVSNPQHVWLVRCSCGDYEVRRTKTIQKALSADGSHPFGAAPSCRICERVQLIQHRARAPSTKRSRAASAKALDRIAAGGRP